ncbi:MAG: ABC transporter ATP-binding protein [Myxococcota bacterium]|nr:ABC transporter ATP-binding protein [Myxococcota bacterium]
MSTSDHNPGIAVDSVHIAFDGTEVLTGVSLKVLPGEIVALQGTSGSGKTTLLHAIAGFVAVDSGTITVGGAALSGLTEKQRAAMRRDTLALMTQDFHLLRKLSAERNAALAPLLAGASPEKALHAAHILLNKLGLQAHYQAPANRLSRGQRQRVALARALALPRPVLLLDEPTSSLDADSRNLVLGLIEERAKEGAAILLATHDASVLPAAHRILSMKKGRIEEAS